MKNSFKKIKQFLAITAIVIIISLYIITLVLAILNNSYTNKFFYASLYATFFVPLIMYLIIWIANVFKSYNPYNPDNMKQNMTSGTSREDSIKSDSSSDK